VRDGLLAADDEAAVLALFERVDRAPGGLGAKRAASAAA
jgi:hypothetical protein